MGKQRRKGWPQSKKTEPPPDQYLLDFVFFSLGFPDFQLFFFCLPQVSVFGRTQSSSLASQFRAPLWSPKATQHETMHCDQGMIHVLKRPAPGFFAALRCARTLWLQTTDLPKPKVALPRASGTRLVAKRKTSLPGPTGRGAEGRRGRGAERGSALFGHSRRPWRLCLHGVKPCKEKLTKLGTPKI